MSSGPLFLLVGHFVDQVICLAGLLRFLSAVIWTTYLQENRDFHSMHSE
jgi:hypothetical protein